MMPRLRHDQGPLAPVKLMPCIALTVVLSTIGCRPSGRTAAQSLETLPTGFIEVVSDEIRWEPNRTVPGGQTAVLIGDPSKAGLLVLRARVPANARLAPHLHPEPRIYTVLSGEWKLGFGTQFDPKLLRSYPAGSVFRLPAGVPHFQATGLTETVIQIESIGPTATEYIGAKPQP
jgi:quercetin dioxygenase-like cupin family protein